MSDLEKNGLHKANGIKIVVTNDPSTQLGGEYGNGSTVDLDNVLLLDNKAGSSSTDKLDRLSTVSFVLDDNSDQGSECSDLLLSTTRLDERQKSLSKSKLSQQPEPEPDGGKTTLSYCKLLDLFRFLTSSESLM